jgi:hypothetical protein
MAVARFRHAWRVSDVKTALITAAFTLGAVGLTSG